MGHGLSHTVKLLISILPKPFLDKLQGRYRTEGGDVGDTLVETKTEINNPHPEDFRSISLDQIRKRMSAI